MSVVGPGSQGAVYDRGYRPYDGPRGRRRAATFALYKASMRRALGIRRSWRQKLAPFVLLGVVSVPAIVNVGIGYVTRDRVFDRIEIITYRQYVGVSSALLLFVALEQLIGWPAGRGITTMTIGHVTFSMAYVTVIVLPAPPLVSMTG